MEVVCHLSEFLKMPLVDCQVMTVCSMMYQVCLQQLVQHSSTNSKCNDLLAQLS